MCSRTNRCTGQTSPIGITTTFYCKPQETRHSEVATASMPVARMRMRPWLEMMIDSNTISGLTWVNKDEKMFCIPWKHAARHGWEVEKDACLFKKWAIHTGKFQEGKTSADPKTWKANFRCAMNSLPDIEEVKNKSINKGQEAVRVYRMLPVTSKHKDKRSKAEAKQRRKSSSVKSEDMYDTDSQSPASAHSSLNSEISSTQENTVDSTENQDTTQMSLTDVPEWSRTVEIGPDSTDNLYARFEVSPEHFTEYNTDDILKLLPDTNWMGSCEESYSSPESKWGDTSSDVSEYRIYTNLDPEIPLEEYSAYNTFLSQIWPGQDSVCI